MPQVNGPYSGTHRGRAGLTPWQTFGVAISIAFFRRRGGGFSNLELKGGREGPHCWMGGPVVGNRKEWSRNDTPMIRARFQDPQKTPAKHRIAPLGSRFFIIL